MFFFSFVFSLIKALAKAIKLVLVMMCILLIVGLHYKRLLQPLLIGNTTLLDIAANEGNTVQGS